MATVVERPSTLSAKSPCSSGEAKLYDSDPEPFGHASGCRERDIQIQNETDVEVHIFQEPLRTDPGEDFVLSEVLDDCEVPEGDTAFDLVTEAIARLSKEEIETMSPDDLLDLLRMSHSIVELQQAAFAVRERCRRTTGREYIRDLG